MEEEIVERGAEDGFKERLARKLGVTANAANIYGTPVERNGITIITVARTLYGLGGGSGSKDKDRGEGGGGGVAVTPVGFIEITNEKARFRPIRDPLILFPILTASSLCTLWALKRVYRLLRR